MNKVITRFFCFLAIIIIPTIFGWWLFPVLALVLIYLVKLPYEIIFAGIILDEVFYFGDAFIAAHVLALFSIISIVLALFLIKRIHWQKII
ncbi:MAG: hypothetical protein JW740_03325 [Candidatus Zambryskibacteria bacterium]|nr:hypothetical protein [Candidatus Zambryskibacteria bacterium]